MLLASCISSLKIQGRRQEADLRVLCGEPERNMTPNGNIIEAALTELKQAISGPRMPSTCVSSASVNRARSKAKSGRVHADRSRLAQELDQAEFRANRLEEVNREVSRRLVTAMETIRSGSRPLRGLDDMAQVTVTIDGKAYRMACEEGQEDHLTDLAIRFDRYVGHLKGQFGEIGDLRITVMAGIMIMDEISELTRRVAGLELELETLHGNGTRSLPPPLARKKALRLRFRRSLAVFRALPTSERPHARRA